MTRLDLFKKMMTRAKANGYNGPDYKYNMGFILFGENISILIFNREFTNALWGEDVAYHNLKGVSVCRDKWEYLSNNVR